MKPPKILVRYLLVKIAVVFVFGSAILFQRLLSSWYDSTSSVEALQQKPIDNPNERNDSGLTALMLASSEGNLAAVQMLLSHSARIDDRAGRDSLLPDNEGKTALHFAVLNGNLEVVRSLLAHGANPLIRDVFGNTPLHCLNYVGNPDMQHELFVALMQKDSNLNIQNRELSTPLHLMVEQDNADIIEKAVSSYGDYINYSLKNKDGYTLLTLMKELSKEVVIAALARALDQEATDDFLTNINNTSWGLGLNQKVDDLDQKGYAGVHRAAIQGNTDYLQALIDKGADLSLKDPHYGDTPLHLVAHYGFADVARLLIHNKAPLDVINKRGETVLIALLGIDSLSDRISLLREVVERGALLNAQDNQGATLLHHSVMIGDAKWISMLLQQFGSQIDQSLKDNAGKTALDLAREQGYHEIIRQLS